MSGRTITRFVLPGLLLVLVVAAFPLGAQTPSAPDNTSHPSTQIAKPMPGKLTGTWYREVDRLVIATTFADDELKMCATINIDGTLLRLIVIADYTVTKDGLVHGAITGVNWDIKCPGTDESGHSVQPPSLPIDLNDADVVNALHALVDCPFSFRTRTTSAGLMISNAKIAATESIGESVKLFNGMYALSKNGAVPTPKPGKEASNNTYFGGMTLPSGRYLKHYPQYFPPDPAHPLSKELAEMEDPEGAARRAGIYNQGTSPPMPTPKEETKAEPPPQPDEDPPSDQEILQAMPRVASGVPYVYQQFREDVVIVKNRIVDKFDPPRFFPLVGLAQLHHCHWECTIYYTETIQIDYPFTWYTKKRRAQVVYIDKDRLVVVGNELPRIPLIPPAEGTTPFPRIPKPIPSASESPPATNSAEKKEPVKEIVVAWKNQIQYLPDSARNGENGAFLPGQLFLFGSKARPALPQGTLSVELLNETVRPKGQPSLAPERWKFTKEMLSKAATTDERFGKCYALAFPWPPNWSSATQVRITARYEPENGLPIDAEAATMEIVTGPKVCSIENVGTTVGLTPVSQNNTSDSDAKKTSNQPTSGKSLSPFTPKTQIQKLLYKSDDLNKIEETWRKYWFPKPGTPIRNNPDRIHGGIIRLEPRQSDALPIAEATRP